MQRDYVDRAKTKPPKEFRPLAAACVKQFREAVKQGKMDAFYSDTFQAKAINEGKNAACISSALRSGFSAPHSQAA